MAVVREKWCLFGVFVCGAFSDSAKIVESFSASYSVVLLCTSMGANCRICFLDELSRNRYKYLLEKVFDCGS
jgi:hypothetical protein